MGRFKRGGSRMAASPPQGGEELARVLSVPKEVDNMIALEAGPGSIGPNLSQSTRAQATIGPATPRGQFEPLLKEVARLNTARRAAGVEQGALDKVEGMFTQQLVGGVPAAVQNPVEGGFDRIHMDYERGPQGQAQYNPITGKLEAVPYLDPTSGEYMVTEVGNVGRDLPRRHEFASEYLGEQILKLMGKRSAINNQGMSPDGRDATWRADLLDKNTGDQVDVQMRWTDGIQRGLPREFMLPQQVYTGLAPTQSPEMTENIIRQRMIDNDVDVVTAVESLINDKQLSPVDKEFPQGRKGKMMKGNPKFTPNRDDQFDKILMPGMSKNRAQRMGAGDYGPEYRVELPDTIDLINLEQVNKVMDKRGSELAPNVFANENMGAKKRGPLRHQVQIQLPRDMRGIAENVVRSSPLTQQLLQNQPFI